MFDFGRIMDVVSPLLGGGAENGANPLINQLAEFGIDPQMLEGLDAGQAMELLAQQGIDIGSLDPSQITDLLGQFGGGSELAAGIGEWLSSNRS